MNERVITEAEAYALERALCGAIGWVAAGINEGNHQVGQETVRRLQQAAAHFRDIGDSFTERAP